jgi:hypothetical protein
MKRQIEPLPDGHGGLNAVRIPFGPTWRFGAIVVFPPPSTTIVTPPDGMDNVVATGQNACKIL